MTHKTAEHHAKAAEHHEKAMSHHKEAEKAYTSGDHKSGAHAAQCACGHAMQADEHADHAAKAHLASHGT
jgi:hypothetical protein